MGVNYQDIKKVDDKFGPTPSGKYYQPKKDHNPLGKGKRPSRNDKKTHWIKTESHQYCVFEEADSNGWELPQGILGMDISDKKLNVLGYDGEKVAFFPVVNNAGNPWHGYPCKMTNVKGNFDDIFKTLFDANIISKTIYYQLLNCKI